MKQKYKYLFKRILYYLYGEKFYKRLDYDWAKLPSRSKIIQDIISKQKYKNYLEIGCDNDENFSHIAIENKIGVDPLKGGTLRMTSDEFFQKNLENFDIIFLDGLHTYDQTIKDINNALNHPTWKMGDKISIDSATMINKVYEVIEAKNIFKIPYKKIDILVHPKSYIHAIVKFKNGLIKIIAHDTTMKIPIFNTLFFNTNKTIKTSDLNLDILNNLNLIKIDPKRYPMIKLLNLLKDKHTLYDTIVVSANDVLVNLFLQKKIKFTEINIKLFKFIKAKEFLKYRNIYPQNLNDILNLNKYVRLKVLEKVYKS